MENKIKTEETILKMALEIEELWHRLVPLENKIKELEK